ncbi:MAG: PTS sugar transporter subunit IIB, partial [Clostridium sp.]
LYLLQHGLDIQSLNVGNMSGRDHTTSIRANINVTDEELNAFKQLLAKNIEITTVMTPNDTKTYLKDQI